MYFMSAIFYTFVHQKVAKFIGIFSTVRRNYCHQCIFVVIYHISSYLSCIATHEERAMLNVVPRISYREKLSWFKVRLYRSISLPAVLSYC